MSASKFAAVTASLLARKGEARPWAEPEKPSLAWRREETIALAPPPPSSPRAFRKCTVRLSGEDHERLGILAVKRESSRQLLLQQAVAEFFARACARYEDCACLGACRAACTDVTATMQPPRCAE